MIPGQEKVLELCEKIVTEQDSRKFLLLARELHDLLAAMGPMAISDIKEDELAG